MSDVAQGGDLIGERLGDQSGASGQSDNQGTGGSGGRDATSGTDGSKDLPNWQKQLTPELQRHKALGKFNTKSPIVDLARAYIEADGRLGKSILIPAENATDEERSRYLSQLRGVETKDGYKLTDVELPDGVKLPEGTADAFKQMAFESGLNQKQADALWKYQGGILNKAVQTVRKLAQTRIDEAKAKLKKDWPGDDYNKNMEIASRAMKTLLAPEDIQHLRDTGQANDPYLWRRWYKVGAKMGEGVLPAGDAAGKKEPEGMRFELAHKIAAGEAV